jgi:hypothetical protein
LGGKFTDKFFKDTLATLSVNGSLYFTPRQFFYFFNQRLNAKQLEAPLKLTGCGTIVVSIVLTVLFKAIAFSLLWLIPLLLIVGFGIALMTSAKLRRRLRGNKPLTTTVTPHQVEDWYKHWCEINGDSGRLLPPPPPPPPVAAKSKPQAIEINPEVKNYSFDRVIVCDRAEIAQCLIANNFHFEHNCAVLSVDGYPHDIFKTVLEMLKRNPALSVYALHDASVQGVKLLHTLRTNSRWFAKSEAKIYDLGLLPRQIFNRSVFVESVPYRFEPAATAIPAEVAATLEPEEVRWLKAGNYVSLESFTPQTLLRVVSQGIAKSRDPQSNDALVPIFVGDGGGGGTYFYTSDSFG